MHENSLNTVDSYELSINQRNLWESCNGEISTHYNQITLELAADVSVSSLKAAIKAVITKNETLLFKANQDSVLAFPQQYVGVAEELEFLEASLNATSNLDELMKANLDYDYDISANSPVRFCLINTGETNLLVVRTYAFWSDSYSSLMFCKDLEKALGNLEQYLSTEREVVEYQNFSAWQNDLFHEPEIEGTDFWNNYDYVLNKAIIPFTNRTGTIFQPKRRTVGVISGSEYEKFNELKGSGTTPDFHLFSKFLKYLSTFSEDSITIGYLPFKRSYEELENTFGLIAKSIPISMNANNYDSDLAIETALDTGFKNMDVWADYFYVNSNGNTPQKRGNFNYCFEYIDVLANQSKDDASSQNQVIVKDVYSVVDKFDLKLSCVDYGDRISIELYYDSSKIDDHDSSLVLSQIASYFRADDKKLAPGLSDLGKEIIASSNTTNTPFTPCNSILDLVAAQVEKKPDAVAIIRENERITYKELHEKSNQLAHFLTQHHKVAKGDAVCIKLNHSEWFVISMLAVIKTGAYYVPIDEDCPKNRVSYILDDCKGKLLLTTPEITPEEEWSNVTLFNPANYHEYISRPVSNPENEIAPEDVVYCIYTSGSTGMPKGCLITQSNLLNYIQWANNYYFDTPDVGNWGLITSLSFDLTVTALYTSLTRGNKLWIGGKDKDILELLIQTLNNPEIDTLKLTPTHLSIIKDLDIEDSQLKVVICGGEQLKKDQIKNIKDLNSEIKVYNEYGPTETTVGCIVTEVFPEDEKILIGKPIANANVFILNEQQTQCPIGTIGEVFIGGNGVSNGYLNRSEMTSSRFVTLSQFGATPLYKTGDLARWLPNGSIEYLGRIDDQVKIRGYRIELGEIENELLNMEGVDHVAVLVSEDEEQELIAFLVTDENLSEGELKTFLEQSLPEYMIPSQFLFLKELPITVNGKTDRKQLLAYREEDTSRKVAYVSARNETEERIIEIWELLFDKAPIGVNDDFFHLGGHSIKLIKLINEYQLAFDVKLELKTFFSSTTVASHVEFLNSGTKQQESKIASTTQGDSYPLSLMQRRLWLVSQNKNRSIAYNMGSEIVLEEVNIEFFEKAVRSILNRHESLRTVFRKNVDGEVRQWVLPFDELNFEIVYKDFSDASNAWSLSNDFVQDEHTRAFDLADGPLLRIGLVKTSDRSYTFYYNMHHIIADAWSMEILSSEFISYYEHYAYGTTLDLPELKIQYKDYTIWQADRLQKGEFDKSSDYWKGQLDGTIPKLQLLASNARPAIKTYNGMRLYDFIDTQQLDKFFDATRTINATPFMNCLALLNVLLYRNSYQTDLIIGSPLAGRDNLDLKDQIGLYINTIPFRNQVDPEDTFLTLLKQVQGNVLDAYVHEEYPFDLMVEAMNLETDLSRNPLFDVMLVVTHNEGTQDVRSTQREVIEKTLSKFDLTFYINITENGMSFAIDFNKDIFQLSFIENLSDQFKQLIYLLSEDSTRVISHYSKEIQASSEKIEQENYVQNLENTLTEDF